MPVGLGNMEALGDDAKSRVSAVAEVGARWSEWKRELEVMER